MSTIENVENAVSLEVLKEKIRIYRDWMQELWDEKGCTDVEVLNASMELDGLMNEYQRRTGLLGGDSVMEKTNKESLQIVMDNSKQLQDTMESIGFHEVAVAANKNYETARQYWVFLKELEEKTPEWMKRLLVKRGFKF